MTQHPSWRRLLAAVLLAPLLLIVWLAGNGSAQASTVSGESRLALVIGNAAYRNSPLVNPVNDARLMEAALKEAGFTVIKAENASIREMRRLVRDFGDRLKASGGVGLFYFAGHGLQVRGENYLVSIDSDIRNEDEVADDAINATVVLEKMQTAGNRMNIIILDACRNNPFTVRSRSSSAGLATMNAPSGSLVAYATAPGSVASDGNGSNGLYTMHLARAIKQNGLPVEEVFKQVRAAVRRDSNNQQVPWENTALEGQFFFKPPVQVAPAAPAPAPAAPAPAPVQAGPNAATVELAFWDSVKASTNEGEIQVYLNRYPNGVFADLARARIAAMRSAATERAAAERAAAERAAAERANAALAAQAARTDPNAADIAFWEGIKLSANPAELQAYLSQFPNGLFAGLVRARLADIQARAATASQTSPVSTGVLAAARPSAAPGGTAPAVAPTPAVVTAVTANSPLAERGVGQLTLKDEVFNRSQQLDVTLTRRGDTVAYSTGDSLARGGEVLAVRIGPYVMRRAAGKLWTLPMQNGAAGEGTVEIDGFVGQSIFRWKVVRKEGDIATLDVQITLNPGQPGTRNGQWLAQYRDDAPLPIWSKLEMRGYLVRDILVSEWKPAQVLAASLPAAGATAQETIGRMQLRDRLTGKTADQDVSVSRGKDGSLAYSTGDAIGSSGALRAIRMGEMVYEVTSGEAWVFPLKAGTSGNVRLVAVGADIRMQLAWQVTSDGRVEARLQEFQAERSTMPIRSGSITVRYGPHAGLPMSYTVDIRPVMRGGGGATDLLQAELQLPR